MAEVDEPAEAPPSADVEEFAQQIADQVESFLIAVRAIARGDATGGEAISLLPLVVSPAPPPGGPPGGQAPFPPAEEDEPHPRAPPAPRDMRPRPAGLLGGVDRHPP